MIADSDIGDMACDDGLRAERAKRLTTAAAGLLPTRISKASSAWPISPDAKFW